MQTFLILLHNAQQRCIIVSSQDPLFVLSLHWCPCELARTLARSYGSRDQWQLWLGIFTLFERARCLLACSIANAGASALFSWFLLDGLYGSDRADGRDLTGIAGHFWGLVYLLSARVLLTCYIL